MSEVLQLDRSHLQRELRRAAPGSEVTRGQATWNFEPSKSSHTQGTKDTEIRA